LPPDLTDEAEAADFRFLSAIRAAMRQDMPTPLPVSKRKKRHGLRRLLREVSRPFEQISRAMRENIRPRIGRAAMSASAAESAPIPETPQATGRQPGRILTRLNAHGREFWRRTSKTLARNRRRMKSRAAHIDDMAKSLEMLIEMHARILRRALRQPIPIADDLQMIRLDDRYVAVPSRDAALIALLIEEPAYEPGVSALLGRLAAGTSYGIDVGANIGIHSITMARAMRSDGQILALEPTPQTFEALQTSLILTGLAARIDARRIAAGATQGETLLYCHPISGQNSLIDYPEIATQPVTVAVAPLDSLVPPGTRVDLVKVDAEGAEFEILKGMRRILGENPEIAVVLEFSGSHFERAGVSSRDVLSFMAGFGLSPRQIDDKTGELKPFDLRQVLGQPTANVLFGRGEPRPYLVAERDG
jgi:FkbM family methyltransferase